MGRHLLWSGHDGGGRGEAPEGISAHTAMSSESQWQLLVALQGRVNPGTQRLAATQHSAARGLGVRNLW